MITWYNTLISVVLALAIGFVACLVLVPREITVQPVMHFSPTMQIGPESFWETPEQVPELPSIERPVEQDTPSAAEWVVAILKGWWHLR